MRHVQGETEDCPHPQHRAASASFAVEMKNPDGSVVHAVQHASAGSKVVQLLRQVEVSCVKYHAEDPTCKTKVAEQQVIFPQRVGLRNGFAQLGHAPIVGEIVEQAEDDGEGLLHAEEAVEGPFAMKLEDRLAVGGLTSLTLVGDYVLADIVAFCWTVPEKEAPLESWASQTRV